MDLLILKKNLGAGAELGSSYRGTERAHPVSFANLPDTHIANQLFFWFVEEGGPRGLVHDLKKAKQLVELLNLFGDSVFYEIVQVSTALEVTPGKGGFLGFDVSAGFNQSLLSRLLLKERGNATMSSAAPEDVPISELTKLHRSHFSPKLNDHRLFQSYNDAEFCLKTARAMSSLRPSSIESIGVSEFSVVSLHKVL